ncbi:MAG: hypothetical protein J5486_11420 [Bacteroidaceae bacterium]|nr:hypothetical protein [Bacteroidaceae bacterium]
MKQRLHVVALLLMATTATWAQSWTAPSDPASSGAVVEDGGTYYIKNVGCGQFITGANAWATQISVSTDFTPYLSVVAEAYTVQNDGVEVSGYRLKMNGTFYFTGDHNRVDYPISSKYLFRDSEANGFVDLGGQSRNAVWILTRVNGNNYRIQSTTENGLFPNAATQYAYASIAGQAVEFNRTESSLGNESLAFLEWQFIPTSISQADITLYGARKSLYEALVEAYDMEADYSEASAVYENSTNSDEIAAAATLLNARNSLYRIIKEARIYGVDYADAQEIYENSSVVATINSAAQDLSMPVNFAKMLAQIPDSSPENPLDITDAVMVNANFNDGNINGWEVTQTMGQNLGYQGASYSNGNIIISRFIEAWFPTSTGPLKDGIIAQTITGLPSGHYKLECDGIAVWQNDEYLEVTGVYLFYDNGTIVYKSPSSLNTGNGKPEHLTFEFDYDGTAQMKIGLMTSSTNANWLAADNFKLYAIGPMLVPPSFTALQNALPAYEAMDLNQIAYTGDISRLTAAISAARTLVDAGADNTKNDTYTAASQELEQAVAAFRASVEAYEKLNAFMNEVRLSSYPDEAYELVNAQLAIYQAGYENRTYTVAQIDNITKDFEGALIRAALDAREDELIQTDLTDYLSDMSFDYTTDQVHYPNTPAVWQNETGTTNFLTAYETAEVWNQTSFNIYREIGNMPAGEYILTVQALFRESENQSNYSNYISDNISGVAEFYAGSVSAPITNMGAIAKEWMYEDGWVNVGTNANGNEVYVPNSQYQVNNLFNGEFDSDDIAATRISLKVVVNEGETLRFGIRASDLMSNAWVVWKDFRLYSKGTDTPELLTLINAIKLAEQKGYDEQTKAEQTAKESYQTTLTEARQMAAARQSSDEEYAAEVKKLDSAVQTLEASIELYTDLADLLAEAQQILDALQNSIYPAAIEAVTALQTTMQQAYDEGTADADQIEEWGGAAMNLARQNMDWETIQKGTDLTFLIKNANFNRGQYGRSESTVYTGTEKSIPGWNVANGSITELSGSFHNIEAYHQVFDFNQTIPNVPAGIYEITVQGFVRVDSGDNDMELYAGISSRTFKQQTDEYSTVCLLSDGSVDDEGNPSSTTDHWPYDYPHTDLTDDGSTVYVPHSMEGSDIYFNTLNPATGLPFYTNIVKIIHKGGDLTLGVRCSNPYLWIIWDNFRLAYAGGLAQDELIEELMSTIKSHEVAIAVIRQELDAAYTAGQQVLGTDRETQEPVIAQMRQALAHADEALEQVAVYNEAFEAYNAWDEAQNWEGWDNYSLLARNGSFASLDELTASVEALNALARQQLGQNISDAQALAESPMNAQFKQTLLSAANEAVAALKATEYTEIDEAHALLEEAMTMAQTSVADYQRLAYYITQAESIEQTYESMLDDEVIESFNQLVSQMQQAYTDCLVSTSEINAMWEQLQQAIRTSLTDYFQPLDAKATELLTHNLSDDLRTSLPAAQTAAAEVFDIKEYTADNASTVKARLDALKQAVDQAEAYDNWQSTLTDELTVGKDLTALIVNPNFTFGDQGWIVDNMFQEGGATEGCVIGTTYTNGNITISKFAESWRPSRPVDDASICQVIRNLPAGAYALEADVITAAYGDDTNLVGVHLFAESTQRLTTMLCRTDYDQPEHRRLLVNHDGGDLTIGVRIQNANANWVAMDNFKLFVADAPHAADIAILKQAHEQLGGSDNWIEPWELDINPFSPAGVTFENGHVSDIDLSGYGLTGQFPSALLKLPQLRQLNLANNALSGSLSDALQDIAASQQTSPLLTIDISSNTLQGNVGILGVLCPQLQTLLANNNQFDACTPALPATIAELDLKSQTITQVWEYDLSSQSSPAVPSIFAYSVLEGEAQTVVLTSYYDTWPLILRVNADGVEFQPSASSPYKGENNQIFSFTASNGPAARSTTQMRLIFQMGDADFSGSVNVADLQTSIRYMFNDWQNRAFNYTAANLYEDEHINVQDVVKLVDVLLEGTSADVKKALRIHSAAAQQDLHSEAYIFWRGNELVLQTQEPVAAADIYLQTSNEINWNVGQMGFSLAQRNAAGTTHTIIYSLTDAAIPAGETVIATVQGGQTQLETALLANRDARIITTALHEPLSTPVSEFNVSARAWTLTAANGAIVAKGNGAEQWQITRRRLQTGIYLLSNALHQTYKVIIK